MAGGGRQEGEDRYEGKREGIGRQWEMDEDDRRDGDI